MNFYIKHRRQRLFLVKSRRDSEAAALMGHTEQTNFPAAVAQVTEPDVDTAGKDTSLSGQEGI